MLPRPGGVCDARAHPNGDLVKYVCEACERLVPPAEFRIEDGLLVLKCPRCDVETRGAAEHSPSERSATLRISLPTSLVEEAQAALETSRPMPTLRVVPGGPSAPVQDARPPEDPFRPPPGHCPKCIARRGEGARQCAFCGLDYELYQPEELEPSETLATAWRGVWESWERPETHDKVLALAAEKGELAALGRLYRIRLAHLPEDAMAHRGRDEVLRLASAGSLMLSTPPPDKGVKVKMAGLGLLFLLALVMAAVLVQRLWMVEP